MSHNELQETSRHNRILLEGFLGTARDIQLEHFRERDLLNPKDDIKRYNELTFKIACLESAINHIRMAMK